MIGRVLGHYRVLERIGEGGMGVVYRARDERLERDVALKILHRGALSVDETRERLRREALLLAMVNHPNIETVYDFDSDEGVDFLVTEFVPGTTLSDRLRDGPLPEREVLRLGTQLAEALVAAHESRLLHRDLKPGNLRVTPDGRLKVLDFGIAGLGVPRDDDTTEEASDRATEAPRSAGTPAYMAPERLRGEAETPATDIYGAGVVLYELATGRHPYASAGSPHRLLEQIERGVPPPRELRPTLSREVEEVIRGCLVHEPSRRYSTARELLADLRRAARMADESERSLAVLYFENPGGDAEDAYLRDGMTEDVITELSKVKTLRVFPRSAVLPYRDKVGVEVEAGRQLGAAHVLAGTLRRAGSRLRITAQLVDSATGRSVWAERYDRELRDVFALQDEIARNIARALQVTLSPQEERAIAARPTADPQAYDCYLRARSYARRSTRSDLEFAIQMYERAIALDPAFATAHAGLGIACGLMFDWHDKDRRWMERAVAASERAFALEPDLPEALAAYARIRWTEHRYDEAVELALRALERRPDCENASWTLGQAYFASDRWEQAAARAWQAVESSGGDYNVHVPYMMALERLGRTEETRALRRRHIEALELQLEQVPDDVRARILLANNHAFLGHADEAVRQVRIAMGLRPEDSNVLYNAACTHGILRQATEALACFEAAVRSGFDNWEYAARDPDLACLRDQPRFREILASGRAVR